MVGSTTPAHLLHTYAKHCILEADCIQHPLGLQVGVEQWRVDGAVGNRKN